MRKFIIIILLILMISCISRSKIGMENERCFDDRTCLGDLICNEEFVCVKKQELTDVISDIVSKDVYLDSGDVLSGYCKSNEDCDNPDKPYCDMEKNVCVQCRDTNDCPEDWVCSNKSCVLSISDGGMDIEDIVDVSEYCMNSNSCKNPDRPHCEPERNICVRCFDNDHCYGGMVCVNYECVSVVDGGFDVYKDVSDDVGCDGGCGQNASCVNGECLCISPYLNCNEDWKDGCEVNSKTSVEHCGECNAINKLYCVENPTCNNGTYSFNCKPYCSNEDKLTSNGCEKLNFFPKRYSKISEIKKVIKMDDHYILVATYNNLKDVIVKLNNDGSLVAALNIQDISSISDIVSLSSEGFLVAGYKTDSIYVIKLNSDFGGGAYWKFTNCTNCLTKNIVVSNNYYYVLTDEKEGLLIRIKSDFSEVLAKGIDYVANLSIKNGYFKNNGIGVFGYTYNSGNYYLIFIESVDNFSNLNLKKEKLMNDIVSEIKDAYIYQTGNGYKYLFANVIDKSGSLGTLISKIPNDFVSFNYKIIKGYTFEHFIEGYDYFVMRNSTSGFSILANYNDKNLGVESYKINTANASYYYITNVFYDSIGLYNLILFSYKLDSNESSILPVNIDSMLPAFKECRNISFENYLKFEGVNSDNKGFNDISNISVSSTSYWATEIKNISFTAINDIIVKNDCIK